MSEVNLLEQEPEKTVPENDISTKPVNIPEKFWDAEKNEIRLDDLIKSYTELEKKMSSGFTMPEDDEGRVKVMRAMGVPETPEEYKVSCKDDLLTPDLELHKRLHAKGFTCEQVQEVYDLAGERLVPMILDIAAEFQADREVERLVEAFGGQEQWREVSRQLLAFGKKNLSPAVLEGMSGSYDGVMALHRMMKGDAPSTMNGNHASSDGSNENELHAMMRDPKYWRDKDAGTIAKVTEGFKRLYGQDSFF